VPQGLVDPPGLPEEHSQAVELGRRGLAPAGQDQELADALVALAHREAGQFAGQHGAAGPRPDVVDEEVEGLVAHGLALAAAHLEDPGPVVADEVLAEAVPVHVPVGGGELAGPLARVGQQPEVGHRIDHGVLDAAGGEQCDHQAVAVPLEEAAPGERGDEQVVVQAHAGVHLADQLEDLADRRLGGPWRVPREGRAGVGHPALLRADAQERPDQAQLAAHEGHRLGQGRGGRRAALGGQRPGSAGGAARAHGALAEDGHAQLVDGVQVAEVLLLGGALAGQLQDLAHRAVVAARLDQGLAVPAALEAAAVPLPPSDNSSARSSSSMRSSTTPAVTAAARSRLTPGRSWKRAPRRW